MPVDLGLDLIAGILSSRKRICTHLHLVSLKRKPVKYLYVWQVLCDDMRMCRMQESLRRLDFLDAGRVLFGI